MSTPKEAEVRPSSIQETQINENLKIQLSKQNSGSSNETHPLDPKRSSCSLSIVNDTHCNTENNEKALSKNSLYVSWEHKQNNNEKPGHKILNRTSSLGFHRNKSRMKKACFFTVMLLGCIGSSTIVCFSVINSRNPAASMEFQFATYKMDTDSLRGTPEQDLKRAIFIPFTGDGAKFISIDEHGTVFKVISSGTFEIVLLVTLQFGDSTSVCIRYKQSNKRSREVCSKANLSKRSVISLNILDINTLSTNDEFYVHIKPKESLYVNGNLTRIMIKHFRS